MICFETEIVFGDFLEKKQEWLRPVSRTAQGGPFLLKFLRLHSRLEIMFNHQAANVAQSMVRNGSKLTTGNIRVF